MDDLTPKQEGFVRDYLDTGNATEAVRRNYDITTDGSARAIGSENLTKPNIRKAIEDAAEGAFSVIVALSTGAENENVRLSASKDILDRAGFKPTEKTDITSGGKPIPILDHVFDNNSNEESIQSEEKN